MGSAELAANLFRVNQTHFDGGKKVRQAIEELGGTMPEDLPVEEKFIHLPEKVKNLTTLTSSFDSQNLNLLHKDTLNDKSI